MLRLSSASCFGESFWCFCIIPIDLPSLQGIVLHKAFQIVTDYSLSSSVWFCGSQTDVYSPSYSKSLVVSSNDDVLLLSSTLSHVTITSITVEANCGNAAPVTSLDLTPFSLLTQLTVGINSFVNVREVKLSGLQRLTRVVVGSNSFRGGSGGGLHLNGCSSLKSVVIGDGSFASFAVFGITGVPLLEEVRIGNGCLKSVGELRFIGMSGLKRVIVGENSLSNAEGDFSLKSCASVTELVVGSGSMKWFKSVEIASVPALETIRIGDDSLKNVDALRFVDLPKLKSVDVGEDSFTNKNGSFVLKNCAMVSELVIGNRSLSSFASFEVSSTPVLKTIEIGSDSLKNVGSFVLSGLSGLESVVIGSNSFSNKNGSFSVVNCTSLESVEIGSSSMGAYSVLSVDNAPLEVLSIGSTSFMNANALRLNGLSKLKRVEINANSFNGDSGVFSLTNCGSVSELVVGDNGMKLFESVEISGVPSLETIHVGSNAFKNVNALRLVGLPKLKRVEVGEDSFTNKEGSFELKNCASVSELVVGNRSMSSFSSFEITTPSLKTITIGSDSLKNVDSFVLSGLSGLKRVVVGSSSFSNKNGTFSVVNCASLESVEIGASSMGVYSVLSVDNAPSLEVLAIGSNAFKNVDALRLNGLSKLKKVEISVDSFTNKEGVFELKNCASVSELAVGDNGMKSFKSIEIAIVPCLETIHVGSNAFKNVNEMRLVGLSKLKRVEVGEDSFTNKEGSFELKNCASVSELVVGNRSLSSFSSFEITTPSLKTITIGDGCLKKVGAFALSGLPALEYLMIGSDSFSQRSGHFSLTSPSVKALVVGDGSFSQYTDCSIRDVPSLETLSIGDNSFVASSLELKNLNGLSELTIGRRGFENCERAVFESLPELTSIQLGWSALTFKDIDNATLVMKNLTKLVSLITVGGSDSMSLAYPRYASFENMPSLTVVQLYNAFQRVEEYITRNAGEMENQSVGVVTVKSVEEWNALYPSVWVVIVNNYTCNDSGLTVLNVSRFAHLQELIIGDGCFRYVNAVIIEGLTKLRRVVVGDNSISREAGVLSLKNCNSLEELSLGDHSLQSYSSFEVFNTPSLEVMEIGSSSFSNVNELRLIGLPKLRRVMIGSNSFTQHKNGFGSDPNRHFYLKNCPLLTRVGIGRYSFSDFSVCVIENVNSLEVLEIGELNELSFNFHSASLELSGLLGLREVLIGKESFEECDCVVMENMSELRSIRLGWNAMRFNVNNNDSSLIVRNLTELRSLTSVIESVVNDCFGYPHHIVLENLPLLSTVTLERAFQHSEDIRLLNAFSPSYEKQVSVTDDNSWSSLDPTITHLTVNSNALSEVPLNRFVVLKELAVGNGCLNNVTALEVIGMNALERMEIGSNSFGRTSGGSNHLFVKNCGVLKSVKIGDNSFIHYTVIEIESVPSLEELVMGDSCFSAVSFELKDLPKLKTIRVGSEVMKNCEHVVLESAFSPFNSWIRPARVDFTSPGLECIRIQRREY